MIRTGFIPSLVVDTGDESDMFIPYAIQPRAFENNVVQGRDEPKVSSTVQSEGGAYVIRQLC